MTNIAPIYINRIFDLITESLAESKELSIKLFADTAQLDAVSRTVLQGKTAENLVELKAAVDKCRTAISGLHLAASTLNTGLTPAEGLAMLTQQMHVSNDDIIKTNKNK